MNIKGKHYRTIWLSPDDEHIVTIIDQRWLPHAFILCDLKSVDEVCIAIRDMWVRGAPLIGAAAAWGMYLSTFELPDGKERNIFFKETYDKLIQTRPTAINLKHALDEMLVAMIGNDSLEESRWYAKVRAQRISDADVEANKMIGEYGSGLIEKMAEQKADHCVNILTHCNAGWLATVDWGTATSPIYKAHEMGIKVHVYVSETRPRNQGAQLTAWEFLENNIPHTLITDNASGHILQNHLVDMVITGTDRTTLKGDVCNKIGTYLKALAAKENNIPFYVALPSSSIDRTIANFEDIPIEQRGENEVKYVQGFIDGAIRSVLICPEDTPASNYAFDITPAKYITGLITEKGICNPNEEEILKLFPNKIIDKW